MKTSLLILFISIILLCASCSKLPIYESKNYNSQDNKGLFDPSGSFFDEKENLNISVSDNDTNLYIQAIFHDRESLMKIMHGGLILYFDPEGKKGKDYQLKIGKSENPNTSYGLPSPQMGNSMNERQQNMPAIIGLTYNKITWDKAGNEFVFYSNILKDPISVEMSPTEQNGLILEVKIPLSEIPLVEGQELFSLGIETSSVSSSGKSNGEPGGGMPPSGGMGGRGGGGGMQSGGGGGRSNGGMSGGGMRPGGVRLRV